MRRHASMKWLVPAAVLSLLLSQLVGCGRGSKSSESNTKSGTTVKVRLPDWAPANPPETLLRAARVLRPAPEEKVSGGALPEETQRLVLALKRNVDPRLWELFGTLSDEQMTRFTAAKQIMVPVPQLTPKQLEALNAVLDANKDLESKSAEFTDFRVALYKGGAKEDLSNVEIGFDVSGGHMVSFVARVRGKQGELRWSGWAQI